MSLLEQLSTAEVAPCDRLPFWNDIAANLRESFRAGAFTSGIVQAIEACGARLQEHFPYQKDDVDELSNQISVSESEEG